MRANAQALRIATAVDSLTRRARIGVVRSGWGGSAPRVFTPGRNAALAPNDEVVARVFEPDELLDVGWCPAIEILERVAGDLVDLAWDDHHRRGRRPGPPLSILMHGPPGVAMTVIVHLLARGLDADLVHLFASAVLPSSNGGSQPIVAPAVNKARGRRRSVLYIDQLEELAVARREDTSRQRALNDVIAEALRPVYGRAPVAIAAYQGHEVPPRALTDRFDHLLFVDVPELDDAEAPGARTRPLEGNARTAPVHQRAERSTLGRPSIMGSAA